MLALVGSDVGNDRINCCLAAICGITDSIDVKLKNDA